MPTFPEWLQTGIDRGWVSPIVCAMHDGVPMTFDEESTFEDGGDPCTPAVRIWDKAADDPTDVLYAGRSADLNGHLERTDTRAMTDVDAPRQMTARSCPSCDRLRRERGETGRVGQPCDICDGRGFDYIGRPCRHCAASLSGKRCAR